MRAVGQLGRFQVIQSFVRHDKNLVSVKTGKPSTGDHLQQQQASWKVVISKMTSSRSNAIGQLFVLFCAVALIRAQTPTTTGNYFISLT